MTARTGGDQLGLMSVLVLSLSSLTSSQSSLRNTSLYPPCARDGDCGTGQACMQYMCYPHTSVTGFRQSSPLPLVESFRVLLRQQSYAIKNQLVASIAPYYGLSTNESAAM